MPKDVDRAEVELVHDGVEVGSGVGQREMVRVVGLAAATDVHGDTATCVEEALRPLVHRLQVCATAVQQEQAATVAAVVAIGDPGAVVRRNPAVTRRWRHLRSMAARPKGSQQAAVALAG